MSSILEALKELENERARGAKKATSVVDVPSAPPRSFGMMIPLGGGLALAGVALGVYLWTTAAPRQQSTAAEPVEQSAPPAAQQASAPGRGPEWLGRAEPPRARVAPVAAAPQPAPAAAPPATERAAVPAAPKPMASAAVSESAAPPAPAEPIAAPAPPQSASVPAAAVPVAPARPVAPRPADAPVRRAAVQQVQMEALSFSSHVHQRTVTLLVDGSRATLHQGESLGGVEVQLIMADGAYLQRGGDVMFIGKPR